MCCLSALQSEFTMEMSLRLSTGALLFLSLSLRSRRHEAECTRGVGRGGPDGRTVGGQKVQVYGKENVRPK